MMEMKPLVIGDLTVDKPIIQGGMGVGISLHRLAGAVAKAGGMGIISSADWLSGAGLHHEFCGGQCQGHPPGDEAGKGDCPGGRYRL